MVCSKHVWETTHLYSVWWFFPYTFIHPLSNIQTSVVHTHPMLLGLGFGWKYGKKISFFFICNTTQISCKYATHTLNLRHVCKNTWKIVFRSSVRMRKWYLVVVRQNSINVCNSWPDTKETYFYAYNVSGEYINLYTHHGYATE